MNEPLPQPSAPGNARPMAAEATRLVSTYADMVMRISYARLNSTYDAEDICQTVFLRLLTKSPQFRDASHERAWIIRTTLNACNDLARTAARREIVSLDQIAEPTAEEAESPDPPIPSDQLSRSIAALPHDQRVAIELRYYEELSISQIADVTGTTQTAVAKRLSRARAALRKSLTMERGAYHE